MTNSNVKRGKTQFGDLRGWIDDLRDADELEEIKMCTGYKINGKKT